MTACILDGIIIDMQVFYYENPSIINQWFGEPDNRIPFLGSNLLNFNTMGFLRLGNQRGDSPKIHIPSRWYADLDNPSLFTEYDGSSISETLNESQVQDYELVFILSLTSLLVGEVTETDISHLKQNPGKTYINRGVIGGYLKKGDEFPTPEEFEGFTGFIPLNEDNYLILSQDLVGQLSVKSVATEARVYGNPIILSTDISPDSIICYPCYIGKDVVINSSYIGPGSVIRSGSSINNSKIYGSIVDGSRVTNAELTDTILSNALVEGVKLTNSVLPAWSSVINVG